MRMISATHRELDFFNNQRLESKSELQKKEKAFIDDLVDRLSSDPWIWEKATQSLESQD